MRLPRSLFACTALIGGLSFISSSQIAYADSSSAGAAKAPATASKAQPVTDPNMVIATVNDQKITASDIQRAAASLPPQARQLQTSILIPLLIDQLISQKAIQIEAEKEKLQDKPDVKAAMDAAAGNVLQNAYLEEKVLPHVNDAALKNYYQTHYASKKPEEEIHARHILVDTEAQANDIIKKLNKGADFAKLSSQLSTDKSTGVHGGDLGWFKREDMIPDFTKVAFSMKPGTISPKPVHTRFGWHVIQVLGTRTAPVPSFDQVRDQIRRDLIREEARKIVDAAESQVKITHYDEKGQPIPNTPVNTTGNGAH
ncbi:peptidylprolyl isomerase [Saccharibacter sp. 17.LH.SD]|uniref:peptidylprolyl isomerase n=1 Tax=Saccharibacter sp. 17.LH.SD TaxID=2689393 RepID=UPI00136AF45A|nr:peptidylprolyl isomerase [Saccharibacter sp. 17.LH.SD]MXV43977.1 peptidylprolyl isomerase [Saccharibacter sp. 17.LH.SD]